VFAYERAHEGQSAVVALNFGDAPVNVKLGAGRVAGGLSTRHGRALPATTDAVSLAPREGLLLLRS
jgi:hypothetical protein